ncbi:MAG: hypothetical protein WCO05_01760 [Candidatus Moraniibacteriota bacterium]
MKKTLAISIDKRYPYYLLYTDIEEYITAWAINGKGEEKFRSWHRVMRMNICDLDENEPDPETLYLLINLERIRHGGRSASSSYCIRYVIAMAERTTLLKKCSEYPSFEHYAFEIDLVNNKLIYLRI